MTRKPLSRRDFLLRSSLALGAVVLTCSSLGYLATLPPAFETIDTTFGKDQKMNQRILVTYATKAGSTVEVAAAIGETLTARGFSVDVRPVKEKPSLDGYSAVVMGSAIRIGGWLPEALDFIRKNQARLNQLPVALYTVHMLNCGEDEASRAARTAYTAPVRALLPNAPEAFFAGKMDYSTLSFVDRLLAKAVEKQTNNPPGDFRDWTKIRAWAQTMAL